MRILKAALRITLVVGVSLVLLQSKDTLRLNPVEELAKSHLYSLVQWEVANFFDKWVYRVRLLLPGTSLNAESGVDLIREYFQLGEQVNRLEDRLEEALFSSDGGTSESTEALRDELARTEKKRARLRDQVEEILEGEIDAGIAREGLALGGPIRALGVHFPPVDFRLDPSPRVLVVSPRDRIEMIDGVLLDPGISLEDMEALEARALEEEDLSVLVEGTGGVATYPAVISPAFSLRGTLITAAHEWLHHYLYFRPLGQSYGSNPDTTSLNETLATIFGREIGNLVYEKYQVPPDTPSTPQPGPTPQSSADDFDFRLEMRETRIHAEELLREGKVEEAEEYMEQRRQFLAEHGHFIRKLNQAYFAFHGTYADSPASVSPIFDQLTTLRAASPSLGDFVREVASFSSYGEFLEELETEAGMGGQ